MQTLLLITIVLACSASAASLRGITYGDPAFGGNGCPPGTVHVAANDDNTTLAILFDSFTAQTQPRAGLTFVRKACSVAIPLRVPPGFHVTLHTIDYRGFARVPQGSGTFKADYFFSGTLTKAWTMLFGPENRRKPRNSVQRYFRDGDFTYRSNVLTLVPNKSCYDRNAILRIGLTQTVDSQVVALIQLDSIDVNRKREIVYSLELISGECPN